MMTILWREKILLALIHVHLASAVVLLAPEIWSGIVNGPSMYTLSMMTRQCQGVKLDLL